MSKEQYQPAPEQSKLTPRPASSRLDTGGALFMAEPGGGEVGARADAQDTRPMTPRDIHRQEFSGPTLTPEQLRSEWMTEMGSDGRNPDTRSTIEQAVAAGIRPERPTAEVSREQVERLQRLGIINANLPYPEALKQVLPMDAADELRKKQDNPYTREATNWLRDANVFASPRLQTLQNQLNSEIDRVNAEAGGPTGRLEGAFLRDLHAQAQRVAVDPTTAAAERLEAEAFLARVNPMIAADAPTRRRGMENLSEHIQRRIEGKFLRKLGEDDLRMLEEGRADPKRLEDWVNTQFDVLYAAAAGTDVSQSPAYSGVITAYEEAIDFLADEPENVSVIKEFFTPRITYLRMQTSISQKNWEGIKGTAAALRTHGLMQGMALDGGYVNGMYSRMQEYLEDLRTRAGNAGSILNSEDIPNMMKKLIDEGVGMSGRDYRLENGKWVGGENYSGNGVGMHANKSVEDVRRAVYTAYDVLVSTQRLAVISSRGKYNRSYLSPVGSAFLSFGMEQFNLGLWNLSSPANEHFLRYIKNDMVKTHLETQAHKSKHVKYDFFSTGEHAGTDTLTGREKEHLGDLSFQYINTSSDFFSSSWRIGVVKGQLGEYFSKRGWDPKKAEDFALFMRLKTADRGAKPIDDEKVDPVTGQSKAEARREIWDKITTYRSETVISLLKSHFTSRRDVENLDKSIFGENGIDVGRAAAPGLEKIKTYDEFKNRFGGALKALREQGYRHGFNGVAGNDEPEQIDFATIQNKPNQYAALVNAVGGEQNAAAVIRVYKNMKDFINNNHVTSKMENDFRFIDLFERTISVDDGLLDRLENEAGGLGMNKLSEMLDPDLGTGSLSRCFGDIESGDNSSKGILTVISQHSFDEKIKAAKEASDFANAINGPAARAKVLRYTIVPTLEMQGTPEWADMLGIKGLPWRKAINKAQEIYGIHTHALDAEERFEKFGELETYLQEGTIHDIEKVKEHLQSEIDAGRMTEEEADRELQKETKEIEERHKHFVHEAEKILSITNWDFFRRRFMELLGGLIIGVFLAEAVGAAALAYEQSTKA